MLTILEGPDCAGKTTLAASLRPYLNATDVLHRTYSDAPPPRFFDPDLRALGRARAPGASVLMDRCWISEAVYAYHTPGQDCGDELVGRMVAGVRRQLERLALACRSVLVIVLPPYDVCHDRWVKRKNFELLQSADALRSVWETYRDLLTGEANFETDLPVVWVDPQRHTSLEVRDMVEAVRPQMQPTPGIAGSMCASPDPIYVLSNGLIDLDPDSSVYRATLALEAADVREKELVWVDLQEVQWSPHWFDPLRARQVLTVDERAHDLALRVGLRPRRVSDVAKEGL